MARLQQYYRENVVPKLRGDLKIANVMQVPRISKITVNMGVGEAVADKKMMDAAVADLTKITGQKPLITKSRKAIASFKLRAGLAVGAKVTLRGRRMYEFLDRLINIAMPRIRDFRGVSPRAFDGRGNYRSASRNRSSSPRSSTTRSTRCGAWTSRLLRRPAMTVTAERCSRHSTSRSGSNRNLKSLWRRRAWSSARSVAPGS